MPASSRKPAAIQNPQPVPQLCLRHTSTPLSWPTSGPPHHFPSPLGPYLHLYLAATVICQIKHEHDYYESPLINTLWILLCSEAGPAASGCSEALLLLAWACPLASLSGHLLLYTTCSGSPQGSLKHTELLPTARLLLLLFPVPEPQQSPAVTPLSALPALLPPLHLVLPESSRGKFCGTFLCLHKPRRSWPTKCLQVSQCQAPREGELQSSCYFPSGAPPHRPWAAQLWLTPARPILGVGTGRPDSYSLS